MKALSILGVKLCLMLIGSLVFALFVMWAWNGSIGDVLGYHMGFWNAFWLNFLVGLLKGDLKIEVKEKT